MLIYQVGFQLSYLAVLTILWVQPWLYNFYNPRYYLDKMFWGILTVTIAAQVGVAPLSIFYFHQFPGLFFVSNMMILPFLTIILGLGIFLIFLALIWKIPDPFAKIYGSIIDLMNYFIHWVASKEIFVLKNLSMSFFTLIASYIAIIVFISFLKKYSKARLYVAIVGVLLFTATLLYNRFNYELAHFAILHQNRHSIITHLEKTHLHIFQNDTTIDIATNSRIKAYRDAITIEREGVGMMSNYFRFKQKEILVIDSLGVYDISNANPTYIVLTQSPKIHLERLIHQYPTATIIADASNYKSYVERWKQTCLKQKIPFHSTYEKGAFIIQ